MATKIYLSVRKDLVCEGIEYTASDGEKRTFNRVTLPPGTVIGGTDYGGWEITPLFCEESRFNGPGFKDIPLRPDKAVWLKRARTKRDGSLKRDASGKVVRDKAEVDPVELKRAMYLAGAGPSRGARSAAGAGNGNGKD